MKKILLLAIIALGTNSNGISQTTQTTPQYKVCMGKTYNGIKEIKLYEPKKVLSRNDTSLVLFLKFIAIQIDTSVRGEEFDVVPKSYKNVMIFSGLHGHQIFLAVMRSGETVILATSKKKMYGGVLVVEKDKWVIKNEKITVNGPNKSIGSNHGTFQFVSNNIYDVEFDDGLARDYKKQ